MPVTSSVDPSNRYVFLWAPGVSREEALVAAARVKLRPATLQGPIPVCGLVSRDDDEVRRCVADAESVKVFAWVVSQASLSAADRAVRFTLLREGVEFTTATTVRRVGFERPMALVDVRWKGTPDVRVQVVLQGDAQPIVLSPASLVVEGPSRQGALLRLQNELVHHVSAASPGSVRAVQASPAQLGLDASTPGEVVAYAIAEGVRRQGAGRR